jgi:hypothetical protein
MRQPSSRQIAVAVTSAFVDFGRSLPSALADGQQVSLGNALV